MNKPPKRRREARNKDTEAERDGREYRVRASDSKHVRGENETLSLFLTLPACVCVCVCVCVRILSKESEITSAAAVWEF